MGPLDLLSWLLEQAETLRSHSLRYLGNAVRCHQGSQDLALLLKQKRLLVLQLQKLVVERVLRND